MRNELDDMEPEGLGHDLLLVWAAFARDDHEGGASWSVRPRVDKAHDGDPPDEWYIVNKIVAQHKIQGGYFWPLVSREYLGQKPRWLIEKELGKPDWWVRSMLCWACGIVEREFQEWEHL